MRRMFFFVLSIVLSAGTAHAQEEGDAVEGRAIAEAQCARCHDISRGADFKKMPPSFQSIAIYRTKPDIWSRIISPAPHAAMPDMTWTLTADQVQDVLAYIISLDQPVALQK